MPIDINSLRVDRGGNPDLVREAQRKRYKPDALVDDVLALDDRWRELVTLIRNVQTNLNKLQKEVIAPKKRNKETCDEEVAEAQRLREEIARMEEEHAKCEKERDEQICRLGNIVDDSVPFSNDENDNDVVSVWPTPPHLSMPCRICEISYTFPQTKPFTHDDLLWRIGGYDPQRGSKVAGGRGYFLQGVGVLLNQALINFAIGFLREREYTPIQVPLFMRKDLMAGIAQLADFDEQLYKVTTGNKASTLDDPNDKYLIATSEQPLCAFHHKEVLDERELPLRYAGISTCFRKEVGKANDDNRGIFRVHQFEKVEQFCITRGDLDESRKIHREMLRYAEDFHKALGIAYRVVNIVSGELNDAAVMKYDLEGWFPGLGQYRELVSCSNCTDYQSRALDIRCRGERVDQNSKLTAQLSHVHMLNSTLTATGRGICCILETHQAPDGVRVPDALVPFMGGMTFLPFVRGAREAEGGDDASKSKLPAPPKPAGAGAGALKPIAAQIAVDDGAVQLSALEAKLLEYPYANGFRPSRLDITVFAALREMRVDASGYPSVHRWLSHIVSFTAAERASWS